MKDEARYFFCSGSANAVKTELRNRRFRAVEKPAVKWAQQQRLNYIAGLLASQGFMNRKDITQKFDICTVQASADIAKFLELNPRSMAYSTKHKRYERKEAI